MLLTLYYLLLLVLNLYFSSLSFICTFLLYFILAIIYKKYCKTSTVYIIQTYKLVSLLNLIFKGVSKI